MPPGRPIQKLRFFLNIWSELTVCVETVPSSWVPRDVTLLKLSLIQILVIKADNLCIEPHVRCQYSRVLELLQQARIEETIIRLLNTSDKVLSHISSKCLSVLVLYQLKYQNEVNTHWVQFCLKSLCQDPGSQTLIPCLTTLLFVCKGFLTDVRIQKADLLLRILVPLENVFERHCSTFITYLSQTPCQPLALAGEPSGQLSCLLDFIETLVALRIELKLNVSLCQQVLSAILPQALNIISAPVPYFIKKQVILLLKRCLLCKAGEDFLPSLRTISHQQDAVLDKDMAALAGTLLSAVQRGWLLQVPVSDRSSSFGGVNDGSEHGPDLVILGATCLSVLKALEIQIHNGESGQPDVLALDILMDHLLNFLKHHIEWKEPAHPCEWVSLTFIEQDDDMLEVAKCLLKLYQHNPRRTDAPCFASELVSHVTLCSSSTRGEPEKGTWSEPSHQCGSNPHCIFLLLLSNVLFDSSVLLDFLISSETCFLEYFVRYLKLLKADWPHFCLICTLYDKSRNFHPATLPSVFVCPQQEQSVKATRVQSDCISFPNLLSPIPMDIGSAASSPVSHTKHSTPSSPSGCLGALQRLVDYGSSEDSESESADSKQGPVIVHSAGADSSDIDKHMKKLELKAQRSSQSSAQADSTCHAQGVQQRAVRCLEDLQEAINRLHRKKLFPYNPSALLRLLSHVSDLSKH
ncbi:PREDICTED: protein Lines homolog 1 [Nanorana parkeri]|uniref:protein Lines homolog 1 n=1 Tax=Nanorana parkeri TaxID=125878 RepID=UPI000854AD57|nr:PREDICTED: protein Lines homolog 1 [Nanorana parkeri]